MTALLFALACSGGGPDAEPSIAWDHEVCARCAMLVSDPRYAAALVTSGGRTIPFDDPGCLFAYEAKHPEPAKAWFHDGERWRREAETAFTTGGVTPMGSGLVTVPAETAGALAVEEARRRRTP